MQAAATYLRTLREKRSLSQEDVASQVGVSSKMIIEWEKGRSEPSSTRLAAFVAAVRGSAEMVHQLLLNQNATEDEGRNFAQQWIVEESRDQLGTTVKKYGLEAVVRGVVEVLEQPDQIERIIRQIERDAAIDEE